MLIALQRKIKSISILDVLKIGIIIFVSFSLFTNINPFFKGGDGYDIVIAGIHLANGKYGYTNELWLETGNIIFVPQHWFATEQYVMIPISSTGIIATTAISYLIGGYYGAFYLGPLLAILFLIISERVTTKLFGSFVGLVTLVLLASDQTIFHVGRQLLTDNIFAAFLILGVFYLIKFLKEKNDKFILISSLFFITSAFFRFNGLLFLPIEVLLVVGYFIFQNTRTSRKEKTSNYILGKINLLKTNSKKILKISSLMILPWLIIFSFWFSFNDYYFGNPLTTFYSFWGLDSEYLFNSFFTFDFERFDWIRTYSILFLPDLLGTNLLNYSLEQYETILKNSLSILSFLFLGAVVFIALYIKTKRTEILAFIPFVLVILLFYSSDYSISIGSPDRFMIPALTLTIILTAFLIDRIWKIKLGRFSRKSPNIIFKSFKVGFLILVGIFLFSSFIDSESVKATLKVDLNFNNIEIYASRYPLDLEGLSEESIIVETKGKRSMEYNVNPLVPIKGSFYLKETDLSLIPQRSIPPLKKLLLEGNDAYAFKEHWNIFEPRYFRYIEAEHGIILKDYSKTFCKMIFIENISETSENQIKSDDICYMYRGKVVPKN